MQNVNSIRTPQSINVEFLVKNRIITNRIISLLLIVWLTFRLITDLPFRCTIRSLNSAFYSQWRLGIVTKHALKQLTDENLQLLGVMCNRWGKWAGAGNILQLWCITYELLQLHVTIWSISQSLVVSRSYIRIVLLLFLLCNVTIVF